jgi:signal transduction histidine kinase
MLSVVSAVLSFSAKRGGVTRLSGLMYLVLASWSMGLFLCLSSINPDESLFWARAANYVVLFLPALLFHFSVSFVGKLRQYQKVIFSYYFISSIYLAAILLSPEQFLHSPSQRFEVFWFPLGGALFYFFPLLFTSLFAHAIVILIQARGNKDRSERLKLNYLIVTIALGLVGGGLSLSLEFNINIPPYGILGVAFMAVISTYAILKHELLELPETVSLIAARAMSYVCIFAFVVLTLKGGFFFADTSLTVVQVSLVALMTIIACELYAAIKYRLQFVADNMLVREKLDSESQFRELMHQLDSADDFDALLPMLRAFFERQAYVHHYAWYIDRVLLDQALMKPSVAENGRAKHPAERSYQRVLFSASDGRRHDRLPGSIRLASVKSASDEDASKQMQALMLSSQFDATYSWVNKVPGREMIGLPIIAYNEFRGLILIVLSRSDMRFIDQTRLQTLSSKLARLIERLEFHQRQTEQERRFIFQKMTSLQALAGSIAHEMRTPLNQLNAFVEEVGGCAADFGANKPLKGSVRQAQTSIERSLQVIDVTLGLVRDAPIDASFFKHLSIQSVVSKALAEYVFLPGERDRVHCDLRHDFVFNGDETLLIYSLFNLLKNALVYLADSASFEINIDSFIEGDVCVLAVQDNGPGIAENDLPHIFDDFYSCNQVKGSGLGLAYCARVMKAFGGAIECQSELGKFTEFRLSFPLIYSNLITDSNAAEQKVSALESH